MLNFVSPHLALGYLLLCLLSCIGVLQIQAARQRLVGLSLWGGRGARWWGHAAGFVLILGSFAGFYVFAPGIFVPGLAGSELLILFAVGFVLALVVTLIVASLAARRADGATTKANGAEEVTGPQLRGWVRLPQGTGPHPALCLVPEVGNSSEGLATVAAQLRDQGFVTLVIDYTAEHAQGQVPRYPDVLATVPAGVTFLLKQPEVDAGRIGLVGFGLGADLALRAAATDERIAAVVAVCPLLDLKPRDLGLDLLRCGSLWQAVQWRKAGGARGNLVEQLDVLAFLPRIPPRPLLVLGHSESALPVPLVGLESRRLPAAQMGLFWGGETVQVIGDWCEEHL